MKGFVSQDMESDFILRLEEPLEDSKLREEQHSQSGVLEAWEHGGGRGTTRPELGREVWL